MMLSSIRLISSRIMSMVALVLVLSLPHLVIAQDSFQEFLENEDKLDVGVEDSFVPRDSVVVSESQDSMTGGAFQTVKSQPIYQSPPDNVTASVRDNSLAQKRWELENKHNDKVVEELNRKRLSFEQNILSGHSVVPNKEVQQPPVDAAPPVVASVVAPQVGSVVVDSEEESSSSRYLLNSDDFSEGGYIGLGFGSLMFNDPSVAGVWSLAMELGSESASGMDTSSYIYMSRLDMDPFIYDFDRSDRYGAGISMRYRLFSGAVNPFIGVSAGMSYRIFSIAEDYRRKYGYQDATEMVFEGGFLAGCDVAVSRHFTVRSEFKYVFDFSGRGDHSFYQRDNQDEYFQGDNYYGVGVTAKFKF